MVTPKASRPKKVKPENQKILKRKRDNEDIESLRQKVEALSSSDPPTTFTELPLSRPTANGLDAAHFKNLTDIQAKAVPLALKGHDILGAAKTGSGKTLAFLVPLLDNLYRAHWTEYDGLGALILSPTRELAIQIFEVLRKIGRYHTFSAGLVIGGKSLQEERERLGRMNILVCTPGRMLQHMDQTAALEVDNLQMLVLDEADRILDMGFQSTVDAIVEHLPKGRQTMLFSATQTKKVSDLARLSLRDPEYVSVHDTATTATPITLEQYYVEVPLPQKLNTLWSFIRANLKSKILVFLSSGKQVKYVYKSFSQLQPGIPLLHLFGRQDQTARLDITTRFAQTKTSCLFATDVIARGLDFPAVDWVIQLDCPEDADTYIHRVGRTARFERNGRAVLFLDPSEKEGMLQRLEHKKVPILQTNVRQKKQEDIHERLQNMCFKDTELKYIGQKAFVSYVKSVHLQKDKEIFQLKKLQLGEFAKSLGLPGEPKINFMKGDDVKKLKNSSRQELYSDDDEEDADTSGRTKTEQRTKYDRMFERRNQDVLASHYKSLVDHDGDAEEQPGADADEDDDFLAVKRRLGEDSEDGDSDGNSHLQPKKQQPHIKAITVKGGEALPIDSKRREKMLSSKKAMLKFKGAGHKVIFDDEGNPHEVYELEDEQDFKARGPAAAQRAKFLESEAERVMAADLLDKQTAKDKRKEKKAKRKAREEMEAQMEDFSGEDDEPQVQLGRAESEDGASADESVLEKEPPRKRPKKWFEDDSEAENEKKSRRKGKGVLEDAETLEDLEQLAASYL